MLQLVSASRVPRSALSAEHADAMERQSEKAQSELNSLEAEWTQAARVQLTRELAESHKDTTKVLFAFGSCSRCGRRATALTVPSVVCTRVRVVDFYGNDEDVSCVATTH